MPLLHPSSYVTVEEVVERRADHDVEDVADDVAGDAAVLGVLDRLVEPRAQRRLDRRAVPAHRLRPGRGHEREHELLAGRVQAAGGAVQAAEREALHLPVQPAALERGLVPARLGELRLPEADRPDRELDDDQRQRRAEEDA